MSWHSTVSTALLLDWALDSLSPTQWSELLKTDEELAHDQIDIEKWDQFIARTRVFGGGFALLAFGLGCIAATITWLAHPAIDTSLEKFLMLAASISAFSFVFIKMLTKNLMSAFLPLILVALFVVIAIIGPSLSKAVGLS